jgi:MFS family permease
MDQSGAVLGPLLAAFILLLAPENYRLVFWLSLIPAAIAVLVIVLFIEDRRPRPALTAAGSQGPAVAAQEMLQPAVAGETAGSALARLRQRVDRLRGPLLNYILITGLFSLGNSSDAFLILRASDLGVAAALIPILYVVFNLVYSGLSIPAGLLADRVGRRQMTVVGYLVFAAAYAGMALAGSEAAAWGLFVLYGVYMGIADGNGRALLAELSPGDKKATAFGFYHSVIGLAALPASAVAGLLWDQVSHAAPFWLGAAAALLAALLMVVLVPEPRKARRT